MTEYRKPRFSFAARTCLLALIYLLMTLPDASLYADADIDSKLEGYWSFDEAGGNQAMDSSPNKNHGTLHGNPVRIAGKVGKALKFDGVDDMVAIDKSIVPLGSPYTVSFWFIIDDPSHGNIFLTHRRTGDKSEVLAIKMQNITIELEDATRPGFSRLHKVPASTEWRMLTWSSDGKGNHRIYLDGKLQLNTSPSGGSLNTKNGRFLLGAGPGNFLEGALDEVRIYSRQLADVDIAFLYQQGSGVAFERPDIPAATLTPGKSGEPVLVELKAPGKEEIIFYTLDGSEPTEQSKRYLAPILVTENTTIRARSFKGTFSQDMEKKVNVSYRGISNHPDPRAVLPQDHPHQVIMRNWIATLGVNDFTLTNKPLTWEPKMIQDPEELFHAYAVIGGVYHMARTAGVRTLAKYFSLPAIEAKGKINLKAQDVEPIGMAWWATWDFPGNPYRPGTKNSTALLYRAAVASMVDMIMTENYFEKNPPRSDYLGGVLIRHAYVYKQTKHLMPKEVRVAYEAGLLHSFRLLETLRPSGTGGGDMETFQIVGMWYVADELDYFDLKSAWKKRAMQVIAQNFKGDNATHQHGGGIDLSYDGIARYFITWAVAASKDPDLSAVLRQMDHFKSELIFPEPDGFTSGPTHMNTATAMYPADDQWSFEYRDFMETAITTENAYLHNQVRRPKWFRENTLLTVNEMREGLSRVIGYANKFHQTDQLITTAPEPWVKPAHWIDIDYSTHIYQGGLYKTLSGLHRENSEQLVLPVADKKSYVHVYGEEMATFKFDDYAGAIHFGNVHNRWAGNISGFGGGAISNLWTADGGSYIQGRTRGAQTQAPDTWEDARDPLQWSTHALTGITADGKSFSSARILHPERTLKTGDKELEVTVTGEIGDEASDPFNAITAPLDYSRTFQVNQQGVEVNTQLNTSKSPQMSALFEVIPVFIRHKRQTETSDAQAQIHFRTKGSKNWIPASRDFTDKVTSIRIIRHGTPFYINLCDPLRVKVSASEWEIYQGYHTNILIDLLEGKNSLPEKLKLRYTLTPFEDYKN